ncbi:Cullin family-domain-containing protein [Lactifluus volemus]|nr:Cullin family-domain-containing protein [Lactifluus volemus]
MWESFQSLLDYDKDEDLQRMYSLLSRIPEGLEPLRKKFEEHVKRTGLAAVAKLVGTDAAAIESLDPKAYVDALLEVHTKSSDTVNRSFRGEAGFVASLDRACREFVNRNAATGSSSSRSPELLAKHADALLRKNNKLAEEGDLEGALNRVMVIFKYLEEKDVFQTFYSTKLSKRLSLDELATATNVGKDLLTQVLQPLVKSRILISEETDQYDLNPHFKSKKIRVNLNQPIKAEIKAESSDVLKTVDEDRKYVIQATIVRIMKARKTMKNQPLIQEVASQISQRFTPKVPDIKKAIETLLEKEYIERVEGTRDTFAYVA